MAYKGKVVFLDTVHSVLEERLTAAGFGCVDATKEPKEHCKEVVQDAIGIVIRSRFPMDEDFLKHAQNLKFIARSGAGMENIDEAYCKNRGIQLFNAPEGNRNAVAEHALGMLLSLFNHLNKADREVRSGIWDREGNRGIELDGRTVAIIGYGNNGQAFARKLSGFDVRVLVYDKYKTGFSLGQVEETDLDTIYREADVVSFHIPQNEETLFWADANFFNRFAKPIYLINLSRGKIVRIADLLAAMDAGKVAGACLDVLEFEKSSFENLFDGDMPEAFQKLLASDKVILSPHVGGWTHESYFKLSDVMADKVLAAYPKYDR
jgi:D-3-phosphoglycerate dehydrogenase / 2-oxoglutarate reductase